METNQNRRRPTRTAVLFAVALTLPAFYVLASGPIMRLAFIDDALPGDPVWLAYEPLFEAAEDLGLDEALGAYVALWLPAESMVPVHPVPNTNPNASPIIPAGGESPATSPAIYIQDDLAAPTAGEQPPSDVKPASFDNSTTPPEEVKAVSPVSNENDEDDTTTQQP